MCLYVRCVSFLRLVIVIVVCVCVKRFGKPTAEEQKQKNQRANVEIQSYDHSFGGRSEKEMKRELKI